MTKPVVMASTLVTDDRVPIEAIHLPGNSDLAIVVAHGFTLSWQRPNVWRIANRLNRMAGVTHLRLPRSRALRRPVHAGRP